MNKEEQELVNEAYKNYRSKSKDIDLPENLYNKLIDDLNKDAMFPIDNPNRMLTKEEFINKCKNDKDFSEKWGLKIEERELSEDERYELCAAQKSKMTAISEEDYIKYNIPTKLITITYKKTIIESYES
jgi:hypothetical protein